VTYLIYYHFLFRKANYFDCHKNYQGTVNLDRSRTDKLTFCV